jgi:hypothetical protein
LPRIEGDLVNAWQFSGYFLERLLAEVSLSVRLWSAITPRKDLLGQMVVAQFEHPAVVTMLETENSVIRARMRTISDRDNFLVASDDVLRVDGNP